jgi:hypothetical protein
LTPRKSASKQIIMNHNHRILAALATVASAVLALTAAVPAEDNYGPPPAAPGPAVRVITAGGMPGWQITVIAVAAALAAATAAVLLDRTRTAMTARTLPGLAWMALAAALALGAAACGPGSLDKAGNPGDADRHQAPSSATRMSARVARACFATLASASEQTK